MADHLRIPDIIIKKRDGKVLSENEITAFVNGVVNGSVQESQIGAMVMAIMLNELNDEETTHLTDSMIKTGEVLQWPSEWNGRIVDKHSTGGVGDKISLVLVPALTACGMKVPMISGRGLAHTGGTLDKLESIPGFTVEIPYDDMKSKVDKNGCCIVGQTESLVPADRVLYSVRDVTGTVDSIGLISASIMSKKAAENVNALVLDVKCGNGAVIKDEKLARNLAKKMVAIGNRLGIKTLALLTDMNNPIGRMVGNSLEVAEALECLKGNGPEDLIELVTMLGGHLLYRSGNECSVENGRKRILEKITGQCEALDIFCQLIQSQGVISEVAESLCYRNVDVWTVLPKAEVITELCSESTGYVGEINALICAENSVRLGAGRSKSSDKIKYEVGLELMVKVGDEIKKGQPWVKVHHDCIDLSSDISESLQSALTVHTQVPKKRSIVIDVID